MYWLITRGIQLKQRKGEGGKIIGIKTTLSHLIYKQTHSTLDSSLGQDALGIGSAITISAPYTITQILSKSTVWVTCGTQMSLLVYEYKSPKYLHYVARSSVR